MPPNLFVTGTDTNVGKTVLSALLTVALEGIYWKPVQTGSEDGTDRATVMQLAGLPEARTIEECYCFRPPVSPHLAAREAGMRIDLRRISLSACSPSRRVIVEGAGGVLTPLNEHETMLHLIRHLGFPAVVASRTSLGTINHTLLTLEALRSARVETLGVVMLGPEHLENRRAIEAYGKVQVVGHVPVIETINREALLRVFDSSFDRRFFG
ncbi:MAG: dethiobiotin synthase [Terriglobia bacterium]